MLYCVRKWYARRSGRRLYLVRVYLALCTSILTFSKSPGLLSYGAPLGLEAIAQEPSTNDGNVFDPLYQLVPGILGGDGSVIRAVDGLIYATRDAL